MSEGAHSSGMRGRRLLGVVGMVLFLAFVASWFIWGPLGLIFYVGGLLNSVWLFVLSPFLFLAIALAVIFLPVLAIRSAISWRRLSRDEKVFSSFLMVALAAFVASFGLGFTGMTPSPFDMFVGGFARYVESRTDIAAIQGWLSTLDPNDCQGQRLDVKTAPGAHLENPPKSIPCPPCLTRFRSAGTSLLLDDTGRPMISLTWGGGLIGHWGIEVGDKNMALPRDSDVIGYQPLAPGAWVWYEN